MEVKHNARADDGTRQNRAAAAAAATARDGSLHGEQHVDVLAEAAGVVIAQRARVSERFKNRIRLQCVCLCGVLEHERLIERGIAVQIEGKISPAAHGW